MYLDQMSRFLVQPADRTPADDVLARALQLKISIDDSARFGGRYSYRCIHAQAHHEESRARIDKALTASLEAERR